MVGVVEEVQGELPTVASGGCTMLGFSGARRKGSKGWFVCFGVVDECEGGKKDENRRSGVG